MGFTISSTWPFFRPGYPSQPIEMSSLNPLQKEGRAARLKTAELRPKRTICLSNAKLNISNFIEILYSFLFWIVY